MGEDALSLGTFLFMIFNFAVLVLGLTYLLYKPVRKMLNERRQHIQSQFDEIDKRRQENERLKREAEKTLDEARAQAYEMIERTRVECEGIRQEKLAELKKELARVNERNRVELQNAREKAIKEVRQELVGLVMAVAGKVLGESMDSGANRRFIEQFLQGLAEHEGKGEQWIP